jgi:hypothetical protein
MLVANWAGTFLARQPAWTGRHARRGNAPPGHARRPFLPAVAPALAPDSTPNARARHWGIPVAQCLGVSFGADITPNDTPSRGAAARGGDMP